MADFLLDSAGNRCCEFCGQTFQPKKPWQRFCSRRHGQWWAWWEWGWNYRYKTDINLWEILENQKLECVLCGANLSNGWSIDHIVPHSADGKTEKANLQALCKECNHGKYTMSVAEYVEHCKRVVERSKSDG